MSKDTRISICACGGSGRIQKKEEGFAVVCEFAPKWYAPTIYKNEEKAIQEWNQMQANLDNIARKAMVAAHRGISYGQLETQLNEIKTKEYPQEETISRGQKKQMNCAICGELIPTAGTHRRRYCGSICADIAAERQRKEHDRRRRQKR